MRIIREEKNYYENGVEITSIICTNNCSVCIPDEECEQYLKYGDSIFYEYADKDDEE